MERELWKIVSRLITNIDRKTPRQGYQHSVGRIVRVYLWATLQDRPVYWACERKHWAGVRPPVQLPDQSTMSRRLSQLSTREFLNTLSNAVVESGLPQLVKFIDGKPLPVSRHSQDGHATFGRGAGGINRGYKLHAIYANGPMPVAWQVHSMKVDERVVAVDLVKTLATEGYLLADANYDSNALYRRAREHNVQLLAPRRGAPHSGLGHHRHDAARLRAMELLEGPSEFGRSLYRQRRQIETHFGNLSSFGGGLTHLPPWVRTEPRVRRYVHAKLIIRAARTRAQQEIHA